MQRENQAIVVCYYTLQSIGETSNSNLVLLPNSPQAGSDMLNNTIASFVASAKVTDAMKKAEKERDNKKGKED